MTQRIDRCPRCNAASNAEAETMCKPGGSDDLCPMQADDWDECLAVLNRQASWEPTEQEIAAVSVIEEGGSK